MNPVGENNAKHKLKEKNEAGLQEIYVIMKSMKKLNSSLQGDMEAPMQEIRTNCSLI